MKNRPLPVYLDHNASTPVLPDVLEAMLPYLSDHYGNPSSTHVYGKTMKAAVERARSQVAALIHCRADEIFFTSGGTEANNLAILGVTSAIPERREIITSVIEHPATEGPCARLEEMDFRVTRAPVSSTGQVSAQAIHAALNQRTCLVTIAHANSETGTLQPIRQIADMAHKVGALVHSDAAQSCGKVQLWVDQEGVDLLSIAGHKLYAPQGVGALYVRQGTAIQPLIIGADHERGLRPGTENVASIVGLGRACEIACSSQVDEGVRLRGLRDDLWHRLRSQIPGLALNGHPTERLPNTLNLRFPGVSGNALLDACPGIAAATGSACHATGDSASRVILAMGVSAENAIGSVRLTLGRGNREEDIEYAAKALVKAWLKLAQE